MLVRVFRHAWLLPGLQVVLRHLSSRRIVRTCVRHLYATHLGRGALWCTSLRVQITAKDSLRFGIDVWFSRSRPCDRLTHKWSGTPRYSPRTRTPSANCVPGSASGVDDQLPLFSFLDLAARPHERHRLFRRRAMEAQVAHSNPSRLPRISRNEPRCSRPSLGGGEQPLHQALLAHLIFRLLHYHKAIVPSRSDQKSFSQFPARRILCYVIRDAAMIPTSRSMSIMGWPCSSSVPAMPLTLCPTAIAERMVVYGLPTNQEFCSIGAPAISV